MAWWIQGVFFQSVVKTNFSLSHPRGRPATPGEKGHLAQFMFFGSIWFDDQREVLTGCTQDVFGVSDLFEISISEQGIRFKKQYERTGTIVHYEFRQRDGGSWIGRYSSKAAGDGIARIVLNEVPDEFFVADSIRAVLASRTDAQDDIPY
jgi:hypothetical protein